MPKATETIRAKCEAVASMKNSHSAKIGEEVRFYVDGVCVATKHLHKPDEYGMYVEGETYEIEAPIGTASMNDEPAATSEETIDGD